jgi:hypothetical protein
VSRVVGSLKDRREPCRQRSSKSGEIGARREANRSQVAVPGEDW